MLCSKTAGVVSGVAVREDRCSGHVDGSMLGLSFDHGYEPASGMSWRAIFSRSSLIPFRQVHIIVIKVPADEDRHVTTVVNLEQVGAKKDHFKAEQGKQSRCSRQTGPAPLGAGRNSKARIVSITIAPVMDTPYAGQGLRSYRTSA